MKVLFVSHVRVSHGAGASLATLALGLRDRGHVPWVVVPGAGTLSRALARDDIHTVEIECPWWAVAPGTSLRARQWYLRKTVQASQQLARVIGKFQPDLVHTNSAVTPSGALAARIAGIPHVWHLREHVIEHYGQRFILGRWCSVSLMGLLSRALIAISRSVAGAYTVGTTMRRMHVVYNGVTLDPGAIDGDQKRGQCGAGSDWPVLALVGTLHPAKGQDEAIRALRELHRRGVLCRLMLIGADAVAYRSQLASLADELGVAQYVTFTGHLDNPLNALARADVALTCSHCEGFGRATVEAMLLHRPIVATNTCGTVELIEDGHTGLLYRQGDHVHLADRIQELLVDPGFSVRLGDAASKVAQSRFSVGQYVDSIMGVYGNVLSLS